MSMQSSNILALMVAYYLSRHDANAYERLGMGGVTATHAKIANVLGVKASSVKNMRDEFDFFHNNSRVGHKKTLRPSRARVMQSLDSLGEEELYNLVVEILSKYSVGPNPNIIDLVLDTISVEDDKCEDDDFTYIPTRNLTGRMAENFFMEHWQRTKRPIDGILEDKRDYGCGYDFEILSPSKIVKVEVKGIGGEYGGIGFTCKEWEIASQERDNYYLAIVNCIQTKPNIFFLNDPSIKLEPTKNIYAALQVQLAIPPSQVAGVIDMCQDF